MTQARRLHKFMGQYFLKGFSAMLAAVEVVDGIMRWHLYYNPDGGRISYCEADESPYLEGINENVLRVSRHIIGWCSHADYLAGKLGSACIPVPVNPCYDTRRHFCKLQYPKLKASQPGTGIRSR